MAIARKPLILFADDEAILREEFAKELQQHGYDVRRTADPDEALRCIEREQRIDLLLTDIRMLLKGDTTFSQMEARGGKWAGVVLARQFRRKFPTAPIILWTHVPDREIRKEARKLGNARLRVKGPDSQDVLDEIAELLDGIRSGSRPRIFIVHGHDPTLLEQVRSLIRDRFGLPDPVVLREQESFCKTLIEKMEEEAVLADLVIVLLTPDDKVISESDGRIVHHARQNVIFEMGLFMGLMGRVESGIILLHRGAVQLPSDIFGILTVDVTRGLDAAEAEIRRELREWLPQKPA